MGNRVPATERVWTIELRQSPKSCVARFTHTKDPGSVWVWDTYQVPVPFDNLNEREILSELYNALLVFMERRDG